MRQNSDHLLSLEEEKLILALRLSGKEGWEELYDVASGKIRFNVEIEGKETEIGLSQVRGLIQHPDPATRKSVLIASENALHENGHIFAQALNSIAGFRLEEYRIRSAKKPLHYLDPAFHNNRLSRETVEQMMSCIFRAQDVTAKARKLRARALGKTELDFWDVSAPCPRPEGERTLYSFDEAIGIVASAFRRVHPEMADFVRMAKEENWIEARVDAKKRGGAFCTGFRKTNTPRVFMSFMGGTRDLYTLAHELGHAFHFWKHRELPEVHKRGPFCLAETASIFAETILTDYLTQNAKDEFQRLEIGWNSAHNMELLLRNCVFRYEFEKKLYEKRKERPLTPAELSALSKEPIFDHQPHYDEYKGMSWARIMHFYFADVDNFPYVFGFLFSLGVYAMRERWGGRFYPKYVSLLRDTGRMSVEELADRHLAQDLTRPEFWNQSLDLCASWVDRFEKSVEWLENSSGRAKKPQPKVVPKSV